MRRAVRAFTLVEVLLTVSIIALLIAILLPAIAKARQAAHSAACLSNLKQIAAAWNLYDYDYDAFPWGGDDNYSVRFGWGGVHWYGFDDQGNPILPESDPGDKKLVTTNRPVNPYLGRDVNTPAFERVFRCPADKGIHIPGAGDYGLDNDPWKVLGAGNDSGEGELTVFGKLGTSYEANHQLYLDRVGDKFVYGPFFGAKDVYVCPSRLVIVGDAGAMTIAESGLYQDVVVQGWWHGFGRGQMAFLDGSARHKHVINATGHPKDYTFYRLP
jgi:prepilin-type N-terminal cleavage/methylation domain-containing protein